MKIKSTNQILNDLPSSATNNSRSIVRKAMERYDKCPSDMAKQAVNNLIGIEADHTDNDWGNGPAGFREE